MRTDNVVGCILGTAVGDALGLPYEALSARRGRKLFGSPERHHFVFGHGMISDDTEHTCLVAQALLASGDDPDRFEESLAEALRYWLLGFPAGIGFATLRAILKLWVGFPPEKSGVFSAGNGPSMRSALLGLLYGDHPETMREFVRRSSRLTHSDPKAYFGALTVACATHLSASREEVRSDEFLQWVRECLVGEAAQEFLSHLERACESATRREPVSRFAEALGCPKGITGYTYHTVPCVIQTWLRFPTDFRSAMVEIIGAGGDTDTTGAILGGIVGARVGKVGIPEAWLSGILEWPYGVVWMERLGDALARMETDGEPVSRPRLSIPGLLLRNVFFWGVVWAHILRRMLPPY